jgi:carboxyl-terminal processing protease
VTDARTRPPSTAGPRPLRRRRPLLAAALALTLAATPALAQGRAADDPRFATAWRLVAERYWDLERSAVDWPSAFAEFGDRPAPDAAAVDAAIEALYEAIGDDHSRYVPADRVAAERATYGDLPCIAVFGRSSGPAGAVAPPGAPGRLRAAGPVSFGRWPDGIGYLRLDDLVQPGVAEGLRRAVGELEALQVTGLVLDLRGNPGGRLVTMMQSAGVFTRGFLWRALTRWSLPLPYPALGTPATELPLAILVDGDVHSAAEGLAGALQQRGRAIVVGAPTAGNVEAVLPFCLRDGAQAWIATGVLAPIGGPTWEGRGVVPDLLVAPAGAADAARRALLGR